MSTSAKNRQFILIVCRRITTAKPSARSWNCKPLASSSRLYSHVSLIVLPVIQTDYIAGPGEVNIALAISQITRYKYNITLRDEADGSVRLNIMCTIEDSMSSTHNTSQWRDVTSQNAAQENKLEAWLYEQIEGELKLP